MTYSGFWTVLLLYVIGSEKTTLMAPKKIDIFYVGLKLQVRSLFCNLFQAHNALRCVVMGAKAR